MEIILVISLITIIIFFMIGSPMFAIIGGVVIIIFSHAGEDLAVVAQDIFKLASAPGLLALPLFILAGYYISESNFAERLLRLFETMVGWLKGGVCLAAIIATDIFTAFTGASAITIVAFGGLIVPMLIKIGHSDKFSKGLMTISGGSGALLPPCFAVILYGIIGRTDMRAIYIAGFIPAMFFIGAQYIYSIYINVKEDIPTRAFSIKELGRAVYDLKWEIPLLFLILIGFFTGYLTIEEAATMTVVGFIIIEGIILKEVKWRNLPRIVSESMMMLGAIFIIMGCALALTDYMVIQEIPQRILEVTQSFIKSRVTFLLFLNIFLLFVGMTMDIFSAILVVVPLIIPIARFYGVDQYHLAVIFFLNLELGYITPPFGISLFIASLRFKSPILRVFRGVTPFFFMELICLLIITYWEGLSLWLIKLFKINIIQIF